MKSAVSSRTTVKPRVVSALGSPRRAHERLTRTFARAPVARRDRPRYCRSMRRMLAWLKTQLRWIWGASEMSVLFGDYPENSDRERR